MSLWKEVIEAIHGKCGGIDFPTSRNKVGIWSNIVSIRDDCEKLNVPLNRLFQRNIDDGKSTSFWKEAWLDETPLATLYPRLFALEISRNCTIAERFRSLDTRSGFQWNWRHEPAVGSLLHLQNLTNKLVDANLSLSDTADDWKWCLNPSSGFTVSSLRSALDDFLLGNSGIKTRWNKLIPIKLNILRWRLERKRLPTLKNLSSIRVNVQHQTCALYGRGCDFEDHILWHCSVVKDVWKLLRDGGKYNFLKALISRIFLIGRALHICLVFLSNVWMWWFAALSRRFGNSGTIKSTKTHQSLPITLLMRFKCLPSIGSRIDTKNMTSIGRIGFAILLLLCNVSLCV